MSYISDSGKWNEYTGSTGGIKDDTLCAKRSSGDILYLHKGSVVKCV